MGIFYGRMQIRLPFYISYHCFCLLSIRRLPILIKLMHFNDAKHKSCRVQTFRTNIFYVIILILHTCKMHVMEITVDHTSLFSSAIMLGATHQSMPIINAHVADLCSVFMDTNDFQRDKIPIASGAISACMLHAKSCSLVNHIYCVWFVWRRDIFQFERTIANCFQII